jgi:hypothetical protein
VSFGGGTLVGASTSTDDAFAAKFDSAGNHLWSYRYGDLDHQRAVAVRSDGVGNVYIAGVFQGTVDFGGPTLSSAGGWDIFLVKLDELGGYVWSKSFGDSAHQFVNGFDIAPSGDLVLAGHFSSTLSLGGPLLTSAGGSDVFVARLTADADHLWSQRFGGGGIDVGQDVAVTSTGEVWITGSHEGLIDFGGGTLTAAGTNAFCARLTAVGAHAWSATFGSSGDQRGVAIKTDAAGNAIVVGNFDGGVDFGGGTLTSEGIEDVFFAKLSPSGRHLWSRSFGDAALDRVQAVAVDPGGSATIGGWFAGQINFGRSTHTANGNEGFVAHFEP